MRVVHLCRHAEAAPGDPDALRELTPAGVEQARRLGRRLRAAANRPSAVLSSPLLRARQTAAIVAEETGAALHVEPLLAPGATAEELRRAIGRVEGTVATIGHQPDCSEIALVLQGRDPGFPAAGTVELELEA